MFSAAISTLLDPTVTASHCLGENLITMQTESYLLFTDTMTIKQALILGPEYIMIFNLLVIIQYS